MEEASRLIVRMEVITIHSDEIHVLHFIYHQLWSFGLNLFHFLRKDPPRFDGCLGNSLLSSALNLRIPFELYKLTTLKNAQCIHPSAGGQLIVLGKTEVELRRKVQVFKELVLIS